MDNIDEMEAGTELDALVAERVIGAKCHCDRNTMTCPIHGWSHWAKHYSTDIAVAWEVVEKMAVLDWDAEISLCSKLPSDDHERWYCGFQRGDDNAPWRPDFKFGQDWALTAPLAICRSALKAIS